MKNLSRNFLLMGALASTLFFTACDDSGDILPNQADPTVSITTPAASYVAGSTADIQVNFTAPGELVGATLGLSSSNDLEFTPSVLDLNALGVASDTLGEFTIELTVPEALLNATATVTLTIEDGNGETAESSLTFEVVGGAINTYQSVLFGAQGNASEGFYNALDNDRLTFAEARDASTVSGSPVDFAYYWGETNKSTLAAIDDGGLQTVYKATNSNLDIAATFGTRNSTKFRVTDLSTADFDAVDNDFDLTSVAESELNVNTSATNLVVGSVVAFELDADRGGYLGLAKVVAVNDTNGNGTITIEVKVQVAE